MLTASATALSWIPSESVPGVGRLAFESGVGLHYDDPPPGDLTKNYLDDNRLYRLSNHIAAWVDVRDGLITGAGYQDVSSSRLGLTKVRMGHSETELVNVALPDLQQAPKYGDGWVEFAQTAGGRTVIPFPRPVRRRPYFQFAAPIIWTTVSLTIYADGRSDSRLSGASDFPRHWLYNNSGRLAAKAGLADFKVWEKSSFGANNPWHGQDHEALVTTAETALERTLSEQIMSGKSKPHIARLRPGESITRQGEPGDRLYLILNGVFIVEVDGKKIGEAGPGALMGERALLEGGQRTATVKALTSASVAITSAEDLDRADLIELARGHHLEDPAD